MVTALETEIGHGNTGLVPWSAFSDVNETVPELTWPDSIATYSKMRIDAQIASLLLAFTLPIRRYGWCIDPNGARDEIVEHVADDLNLPIEGQDPKRRAAAVTGSVMTGTFSTLCSISSTGTCSWRSCTASMRGLADPLTGHSTAAAVCGMGTLDDAVLGARLGHR